MGFKSAGIDVIWANDFDKNACETYKKWSDAEVVQGDIAKVDFSTIPPSDIILGGFPCQGFSLAGPRKVDDSRNVLYQHFVKLVELKKPLVFVAENVKGLLTLGGGAVIDKIISDFSEAGYNVSYRVLDAEYYGVPQYRPRVILIGTRKDIGEADVFSYIKKSDKIVTLREAIGDLPEPDAEDVCEAPYSSRYMSRNRKRGWDEVSFTIPAMAKQVALHPSSPDMVKLEPDSWKFGEGKTRRLSYREAAVIQGFPFEMEFSGNLTEKYKQIGNAVPVKLGRAIGEAVFSFMQTIS